MMIVEILISLAILLTVMVIFCVLNAADYREEWDEKRPEEEATVESRLSALEDVIMEILGV